MSNTSSEATFSPLSTTATTAAVVTTNIPSQLIHNFLTCPLCLKPYKIPKLLPCLHTFCEHCLVHLHSSNHTDIHSSTHNDTHSSTHTGTIVCPSCSHHTILLSGGISDLKDNSFVVELLEELQRQYVEIDRRFSDHLHNNKAFFSSSPLHDYHTLTQTFFEDRPEKTVQRLMSVNPKVGSCCYSFNCPKHQDEVLSLYCRACEVLLCALCAVHHHDIRHDTNHVTNHDNSNDTNHDISHGIQPLQHVNQHERASFRETIEKTKNHLLPLDNSLKNISKTLHKLHKQQTEAETEIETHFKKMNEALEARRKDLLTQLKVKSDYKKDVLMKEGMEVMKLKRTFQVSCEYIQDKLLKQDFMGKREGKEENMDDVGDNKTGGSDGVVNGDNSCGINCSGDVDSSLDGGLGVVDDDKNLLLLMAKRELQKHYDHLFNTSTNFHPHQNPFISFDAGLLNKLIYHLSFSNQPPDHTKLSCNNGDNNEDCTHTNTHTDAFTNTHPNAHPTYHTDTHLHTNTTARTNTHTNDLKQINHSSSTLKSPSPTTPKVKKPSVNFDPSTKTRPDSERSNGGEDWESTLFQGEFMVGRIVSSPAVPHKTEAENIKRCYLNTPTKIMVSTKDYLNRSATNDGVKLSAKIFNLTSFRSRSRESSTSRCTSDKMSVGSNDNTLDLSTYLNDNDDDDTDNNNNNGNNYDDNDGNNNDNNDKYNNNTSNVKDITNNNENDKNDNSNDNNDNSLDSTDDGSINRGTFDELTSKTINKESEKLIRKKIILVPKIKKVGEYNFEVSFTITDDLLKTIRKYEERFMMVMGVVGIGGLGKAVGNCEKSGGTSSSTPTKSLSNKNHSTPRPPLIRPTSPHQNISFEHNNMHNNKNKNNKNTNKNNKSNQNNNANNNDNNVNNKNKIIVNKALNGTTNFNSSNAKLLIRPLSAQLHRTATPTTTTTFSTTTTLATIQLEINLFNQPIKNSPLLIRIKPQSLAFKHKNLQINNKLNVKKNTLKSNNNNNFKTNNKNNNSFSTQSSNNSVFSEPSPSDGRDIQTPFSNHIAASPNPDSQSECFRIGSKGHEKGHFANMQGIGVHEGMIAVADSNAQRIQVFSTEGTLLLRFGVKGRSQGQLTRPTGVTFTRDGGHLIVSDYENKCVNVYESANGKFVNKIGQGKLIGPKGVIVDDCDRLVVVDNKASVVWLFSLAGKLLGKFGSRPISTSTDQSPSLKRNSKTTSSSSSSLSFTESTLKLAGPHFCGIDPGNGDVVVTDFHNHSIKVFSSQGKHKLTFGQPGNAPGQISAPTGCCVDKMGHVLIADWGNSRIQIFDKTGTYVDKVNTGSDPLYGPQGLALTRDHTRVVVADSGNHCLKIFKHPLID